MDNKKPYFSTYTFIREAWILPVRVWFYKLLRLVLVIFIVASIANLVFSYFFFTPKMYNLWKKNSELTTKYELLQDRIALASNKLNEINRRDAGVYRSIFAVDTVNIPGVYTPYADSKYDELAYGRFTGLLTDTWKQLDALGRQLYERSISFDELVALARDKDLMTESVPAIWPVNKKNIRGHIGAFGGRIHPKFGGYRMHTGIDLAGRVGEPIYATGNGFVAYPDKFEGYGKQILVDHGFGYKTRYAHLSAIYVEPGQYVRRGEKIGALGNTGRSTGPHLHYEVIYRNKAVNPINYFSRDMSAEEFEKIISSAKETTYEKD